MKFKIFGIVLILVLISCQPQQTGEQAPLVEFLTLDESANMPLSEAVSVGNWLILSGQIGINPETGTLPTGGIKAETKQTMENIKRTLKKYGSSLDQVVKCTVVLADISEWSAMNEVYVTYFPNHKPARSAFGTSGLALGARLEIECWAEMMGDTVMTAALLDRLLHHARVFNLDGESYRIKNQKKEV